jgi:hypothetical protein
MFSVDDQINAHIFATVKVRLYVNDDLRQWDSTVKQIYNRESYLYRLIKTFDTLSRTTYCSIMSPTLIIVLMSICTTATCLTCAEKQTEGSVSATIVNIK